MEVETETAPSVADKFLLDHRLHCDCGKDITRKATHFMASFAASCGSGKSKARTFKQCADASRIWWESKRGMAKRKAASAKRDKHQQEIQARKVKRKTAIEARTRKKTEAVPVVSGK